ncbi:MAG: hypothetical protein H7Y07_18195, partial [Pyrinomonadaceae bacterium]|nr:hypothetical protein [Sphingobacteriaceae bacterium]
MKYLLFLFLYVPFASAAENSIDSLSRALKSSSDSEKQDIYFKLGTAYANESKFKEAINIYTKLIVVASKSQDKTLVASS